MAKDTAPTPEDLGIPINDTVETPGVTGGDTASDNGPAPKKRRGRPPGSGTKNAGEAPKKSASRKAEDVEGLARQIEGIHQLMAMATGMGELCVSSTEANMLAKGITAVTEEYGFALSGKTGAAFQLFGAAAIVYVPRALAIKAKIEAAKRAAQAEADAQQGTVLDGAGLVHATAH